MRSSTPSTFRIGDAMEFQYNSCEAERRALERGIQGVKTASFVAFRRQLTTTATFSLQMDFFCKAAWPTNHCIGPDTQDVLLQRMKLPVFFLSHTLQRFQHQPVPHPGFIVPLSQLSGIENSGVEHYCTETDASSVDTGSSNGKSSNSSSVVSSSAGKSDVDVGSLLALALFEDG